MKWDKQLDRWLAARLPGDDRRRVVVVTGARQVGKTTLVRSRYPNLRYINLDAIENREALRTTPSATWGARIGPAIIDEAQKAPEIFEKVKYAYDEAAVDFTVLTGSSRFLLLQQVRESLAGRAFTYELWPLLPSELRTVSGPLQPPLLDAILEGDGPIGQLMREQPARLLAPEHAVREDAWSHLCAWGGMPELGYLLEDERKEWLRSYQQTFLERDLVDLVRLSDLHPFRTLQRLVMLRTGQLLQYSELARDAGIAPTTAKNYLEYLRLSYQALLLQPYHRNLTSSIVKTPKVYWCDLGLLRSVLGQWGPLTGEQFETLVVVEIHKWLSTMGRSVQMYFYRTRSGMEVDLLLETASGIIGVEVKQRASLSTRESANLRKLADALGPQWRGGVVVYAGDELRPIDVDHDIWAMPAPRLF